MSDQMLANLVEHIKDFVVAVVAEQRWLHCFRYSERFDAAAAAMALD